MPITQSKLRAFRKEFPWLELYLNSCLKQTQNIERLDVQRLDLQILDTVPYYHKDSPARLWKRLFLIYDDKALITEVDQAKSIKNPQKSLWRPSTWEDVKIPGKSLKQALTDRTSLQGFEYVLSIQKVSIIGIEITIYKLPKSFSLQEWIEELHAREEAAVQHESMLADWDGQIIAVLEKETSFRVSFPSVPDSEVIGSTAEEALGKFMQRHDKALGLDIRFVK